MINEQSNLFANVNNLSFSDDFLLDDLNQSYLFENNNNTKLNNHNSTINENLKNLESKHYQ